MRANDVELFVEGTCPEVNCAVGLQQETVFSSAAGAGNSLTLPCFKGQAFEKRVKTRKITRIFRVIQMVQRHGQSGQIMKVGGSCISRTPYSLFESSAVKIAPRN